MVLAFVAILKAVSMEISLFCVSDLKSFQIILEFPRKFSFVSMVLIENMSEEFLLI